MTTDSLSSPTCSVCNKISHSEYMKVGKYTYLRCEKCSGIFVYPLRKKIQTETYLDDVMSYLKFFDPFGQLWMIKQFERLYEAKMGAKQRGKIFEIGAGAGHLALFAIARGWEIKGIETSASAVKYAVENLKMQITKSTIEDYKGGETFGGIIMVEVLEHFLYPLEAVKEIKKICKKRTLLFGTTPNTDSDHWKNSIQNIYAPDDHIFLFNKKSLKVLAKKAGIKRLTIEYFGAGEKNDSNLMFAGILSNR